MPERPASSSSAGLAALASSADRALDRCERHPDGAAVATELVFGTVGVDLVATLAALHRSEQRLMCVGDGVAFVGIGAAAGADEDEDEDNGVAHDVVALQQLLRVPHRRVALTLPFVRQTPAAALGDTSWRRLRRRRLWAPRVWIHADRDGHVVVGVDLGDDVAASARAAALVEARAIIGAWGRADAAPADTSWDVGGFVAQPDQHAHHAAVVRATDVMGGASSALSKVVLARRRRASLQTPSPSALAARLFSRFNTSSTVEVRYLVGDGDDVFVGCTPERLVSRRGTKVSVDVLAGTARLGHDEVQAADKERREHASVKTFVVERLRRLGASVEHAAEPQWRRLAVVQHLWTPVRATLPTSTPAFQVLHPTPAVAGVPLDEAQPLIAELEAFDRGLYSGAIGVASADGEDLWVALRCAHLHDADGTSVIDLFAGGGLVTGSDPAAEWRELDDKERTVRGALERAMLRSP